MRMVFLLVGAAHTQRQRFKHKGFVLAGGSVVNGVALLSRLVYEEEESLKMCKNMTKVPRKFRWFFFVYWYILLVRVQSVKWLKNVHDSSDNIINLCTSISE